MRNSPPRVEYVWPLAVGASWTQTYHHERLAAGTSYNTGKASSVEREETVTVPAGTFRTLKIVWVRQHEPSLKEGPRTRELVSFTLTAKVAERRSP